MHTPHLRVEGAADRPRRHVRQRRRRRRPRDTPRPAADVPDTWADVDAIGALTGYAPTTPLSVGIPHFVKWFKAWQHQRESLA